MTTEDNTKKAVRLTQLTSTEYRRLVIDLFRSGEATEDHWQEMASAVYLYAIKSSPSVAGSIDYRVYESHAKQEGKQ